MSELSGNLQDFPLPDVLRLLGKGKKQGVLHVYGDVSRGRIYLDEGRISYATTRAGDEFADSDQSAGNERRDRRRVELAGIKDRNPAQFQEHLKAQIIEVLVRLGRETSGNFVFQTGISPEEPVKEPFLVEEILVDAEAELKEWTRIEGIIGSTTTPMTMVPNMAADKTITVDGLAWNALAAMAARATAKDIAAQLGQFEIVAARTLARLIEQGLVEPAEHTAPVDDDSAPEVELSEVETKAVLSALGGGLDEDEPATGADNEDGEDEPVVAGPPVGDVDEDGWGGLGRVDSGPHASRDDEHDEDLVDDDDHPPASELARRWRNLRSSQGG